MGGSVSLPNLPEHSCADTGREGLQFFSGQAEVLTFEDVISDQPRDISQSGVTPPRKTPLRAQRFGSSIVSRDRVQQTLPRHIELCDDRKAVKHAQSSLEQLGSVIRDFELFGRGPEVNAAQPHRRMRGLDFLYSVRNDSAMLPKPEDEGGMKTREDNDEELQNDQRRSRVWKLLRTVPYFMTLETSYNGMTWKLSKKCQFFKEAAGQVVFRQGDPAGNCYVVVTGEVAVKIFKDTGKDEDKCPSPREVHEPRMYWYETLTQHEWGTYRDVRSTSGEEEQQLRKYFAWASPKKPAKQKADTDTHVKTMRRRSMQSVLAIVVEAADAVDKSAADVADDPERDMTLYEQLQQEDNPRYKTAEGHCTWCPQDSCLGDTVVTLGAGSIFGEMALQNDKPRAATIECVQDCEFLVIPRFVYRRILKEITSRSADSLKASSILRKLDFFMDMEAERPGTIDRLAQKTAWQDCPAGQVIFRQQDPPGNCYVLCEGTVDVYKCGPEMLPREGERRKLKRTMTPRTCTMFDMREFTTLVEAMRGSKGFRKDQRYLTLERFSCFCKASVLGPCVVTLEAPACFGELALKNTQPRAATVKCRTKCRLMILEKQHVLHVLTEVMARVRFFNDRLPGIGDAEYRMDHPCQYFSLRKFPQGYQFTHEGITMTEPALYVLKSGALEFRRYRRTSQNPVYVLSHLPMVESAWKSVAARPRTGVAGSKRLGSRPKSRSIQSRTGRKQLTPRDDFGEEVVCDIMHDEGVFCTLPFFPLFCAELFSVVAASPVEVFHIASDNIKKLGADYVPLLRKHLLLQLKERIRKLPSDVAEVGEEAAQAFDSKGHPFYKAILEEARRHHRKYKPTYEEHILQLQKQGGILDKDRQQESVAEDSAALTPLRALSLSEPADDKLQIAHLPSAASEQQIGQRTQELGPEAGAAPAAPAAPVLHVEVPSLLLG